MAIFEQMKAPRVEQKAEEYVTIAAGDKSSTSQSRKRFTAVITGLVDPGAKETDALRQHFEECGRIERIRVVGHTGQAYIDFTSVESLKKALKMDKTVCGRPVNIYILFDKGSTFRAVIRGFDAREPDMLGALRDHFKDCGDIEDTRVPSPEYAYIDFVNKGSLYKALELNNTTVDGYPVTVKKAYSLPSQYKAEIRGFDTGAGPERVNKALRKHFERCEWIEEISFYDGCACIAFSSKDTLFKALDLNNSTMDGGYSITVQQGFDFYSSRFSADISWPDDVNLKDFRPHFEKCGGIVGIHYSSHSAARIDFTSLDSLNKALELNNTTIDGNHTFTVVKCDPCVGYGGS